MRNHTVIGGSRHLLLASLVAASGAALAGCVAYDAGDEQIGDAQQAVTVCVDIQGTAAFKDAFLFQGSPATNYGWGPDMYAGIHASSGTMQSAVLEANLSQVPAGATIVSADLSLSVKSWTPDTVRIRRITAPWDQHTITWNSHSASKGAAVEGSFAVGNTTRYTVSLTALVQSWVNGSIPNYGIMFEQDANRTQLRTSEIDASQQPILRVCYDTATGSSSSTSSTTATSSVSSSTSSTTASSSVSSSTSSTTATSSATSSTTSASTSGSGGAGGAGGAGG
ncbi:MAG TPA: DNRLRE domain-containing protein, partial [Sorangium sp.]|nr:DNRLRE domain-containing protein [Sorangium sp.]